MLCEVVGWGYRMAYGDRERGSPEVVRILEETVRATYRLKVAWCPHAWKFPACLLKVLLFENHC